MGVDYHGWTHRPKSLGGTDPIPCFGAHEWIALTTANQGYEADGSDSIVEWLEVFQPSNASAFSYEIDPGAGQFGDDIFYAFIEESGVYSWCVNLFHDEDFDLTSTDVKFRVGVEVLDGPNVAGDPFPGRQGSSAYLYDTIYIPSTTDWDSDLNITRTFGPLPIAQTPGQYPLQTGRVSLDFNATGIGDTIFSVRLFIVRHDDHYWPGSHFGTPTAPS